jgi:hypothetical protein
MKRSVLQKNVSKFTPWSAPGTQNANRKGKGVIGTAILFTSLLNLLNRQVFYV